MGTGPVASPRDCDGRRATVLLRRAADFVVSLRIGIDIIQVELVAQALAGPNRDRYLSRVYTEREVDECSTRMGIDPACLAARFAAKEATLKVILVRDVGVSLTSIEVRTARSGRLHLELRGRAATCAADAGVVDLALSVTHGGGLAAAVVLAECQSLDA